MLVLTRRIGERIVVDGPCAIMLVEIKRGDRAVRIGIEAAREVTILRDEVPDRREQP